MPSLSLDNSINHLQSLNTEKNARWVGWGIAILAVLLLLHLFWQIFQLYQYQATPVATRSQQATKPAQNYQARTITQSYLFGKMARDNALPIPETGLQLVLRGAFTSSNPALASAIIETPDGKTNSYRIEKEVYGQAKLHEVHGDRIVLSRNGELETLYFPTPSQAPITTQNENADATAAAIAAVPDNIQQLVQDNMSADEIQKARRELTNASLSAEQRQALIRKRLQDLRDRARKKRQAAASR